MEINSDKSFINNSTELIKKLNINTLSSAIKINEIEVKSMMSEFNSLKACERMYGIRNNDFNLIKNNICKFKSLYKMFYSAVDTIYKTKKNLLESFIERENSHVVLKYIVNDIKFINGSNKDSMENFNETLDNMLKIKENNLDISTGTLSMFYSLWKKYLLTDHICLKNFYHLTKSLKNTDHYDAIEKIIINTTYLKFLKNNLNNSVNYENLLYVYNHMIGLNENFMRKYVDETILIKIINKDYELAATEKHEKSQTNGTAFNVSYKHPRSMEKAAEENKMKITTLANLKNNLNEYFQTKNPSVNFYHLTHTSLNANHLTSGFKMLDYIKFLIDLNQHNYTFEIFYILYCVISKLDLYNDLNKEVYYNNRTGDFFKGISGDKEYKKNLYNILNKFKQIVVDDYLNILETKPLKNKLFRELSNNILQSELKLMLKAL